MIRFHADDLGLHPLVDSAIFSAFHRGALAGASILVNGATFADAARRAQSIGMPVALHLNLVDGEPLCPPDQIRTLVGSDDRFPASYRKVTARAVTGRLRRNDLRAEVRRQLELFRDAGLAAGGTFIDGHQHLHLLPVVTRVILDLADEFQIRQMRIPRRSAAERRERSVRSAMFAGLEWLGRRAAPGLAARGIQPVACWGALYAGHLTTARARAVVSSVPVGSTGQLLCHPGADNRRLGSFFAWDYDWQGDLDTVLAVGPELGR